MKPSGTQVSDGPAPLSRVVLISGALLLAACASPRAPRERSLRENSVENQIRESELSQQESAERYGELDRNNKVIRTLFKGAPITF